MSRYLPILNYADSSARGRGFLAQRRRDLLDLKNISRLAHSKPTVITANAEEVIHIDARVHRSPNHLEDLTARLRVYPEHKLPFLQPVASEVSILV